MIASVVSEVADRRSEAGRQAFSSAADPLTAAADQLATGGERQWQDQAERRRINDRNAFPVPWQPAPASLVEGWSYVVDAAAGGPDPDGWATAPADLAASDGRLGATLRRVPRSKTTCSGRSSRPPTGAAGGGRATWPRPRRSAPRRLFTFLATGLWIVVVGAAALIAGLHGSALATALGIALGVGLLFGLCHPERTSPVPRARPPYSPPTGAPACGDSAWPPADRAVLR